MPSSPAPEDKNSILGKNMMLIAWLIAIALLTWIFGSWEQSQFNPNDSPVSSNSHGTTEVVLKRNRYSHYVVSGSVNHQKAVFMLDTGATLVAIPGQLQEQLGLVAGQMHYTNTANGTTKAYSTIINRLAIGDIILTDVQASIVPTMQGEEILLGMSVLKQLEFTQKGDQLTLRQYN